MSGLHSLKPETRNLAPDSPPPVTNRDALCPSCERFIGPADVCPYCGADSARRPLLRHLRWAALFLAIAGVAGLTAVAARREAPAVVIGEISPAMNFAYVRVAGKVVSEPRVLREGGEVDYVSLILSDGTGQLRVQADGAVALALARKGGIPRKWTRVEAAGTLNVSRDGSPRLRLQTTSQLRICGEDPVSAEAKPGRQRGS
jgi:hypothetical protein